MSWGSWGSGGSPTPDWSALAAAAERRRRRRRWAAIGGSAAAALAIGTVVALLIVSQSGGGGGTTIDEAATLPDTEDADPSTTGATPSFEETTLAPLPSPSEFIADPDKDTAPFRADDLYAGDTATVNGRTYDETATHGTDDCGAAATAELGAVLAEHGCRALLRATYTRASDGVAVTVGVAQFPTEADAEAARDEATPSLEPLITGETPSFCQNGGCRVTSNQIGRYAYFTVAGNSDGTPDSGTDTPAQQAARDGNDIAFELLVRRGEAQASASASARVSERENKD